MAVLNLWQNTDTNSSIDVSICIAYILQQFQEWDYQTLVTTIYMKAQGNYPKHLFLLCNLLIKKVLHISANRTGQPIYSIQNLYKNLMKPQELKWDYVTLLNRSSWDHQCPLLAAFALKKSSLGRHTQSKTNWTKDRGQQMSRQYRTEQEYSNILCRLFINQAAANLKRAHLRHFIHVYMWLYFSSSCNEDSLGSQAKAPESRGLLMSRPRRISCRAAVCHPECHKRAGII